MTWMTSIKASLGAFFILFGVLFSSVQANPIGRQVGLSGDIQILTINETQVCQVGGNLYRQDEDLPTEDPCEYCTCQPPGLACEVIKCKYKPGCRTLQRAGLCCPEFICECEFEGKIYENGDRIKPTSNPCQDCYCITGDVKCSIISCGPPPPGNCLEVPVEGKCCPNYECGPSPLKEEETLPTDTEESVTEVSTEDQSIQESQSDLGNAEIETIETITEPEAAAIEEQDTLIEDQEQAIVEPSVAAVEEQGAVVEEQEKETEKPDAAIFEEHGTRVEGQEQEIVEHDAAAVEEQVAVTEEQEKDTEKPDAATFEEQGTVVEEQEQEIVEDDAATVEEQIAVTEKQESETLNHNAATVEEQVAVTEKEGPETDFDSSVIEQVAVTETVESEAAAALEELVAVNEEQKTETVYPDVTTGEEQSIATEEHDSLTFKGPESQVSEDFTLESTVTEDSDSENSIFIQILPLKTTTTISPVEDIEDKVTVSETPEFEGVPAESFSPTEIYDTEEHFETGTNEDTIFEVQVASESTTDYALEDGYVTTQISTLENNKLAKLEMTTVDSHLENEDLDTTTDISTNEPNYLKEESFNEPTEISATGKEEESLDVPATVKESITVTTENFATVTNELGTDLVTKEALLTDTITNKDEQLDHFEIYHDPDFGLEDIFVSTHNPTEIASQEESTTEGQALTDYTRQAASDDILNVVAALSALSEDILDEVKSSTITDFSDAQTTTLSSDLTTLGSTEDEITTVSPEESHLENLKDEDWTSLLNTQNEDKQHIDPSSVVIKGQHVSAPANSIEKFETSFNENQHFDKFHVNDERFSSASEMVINEQPYDKEPLYITEKIIATEENLQQTNIPQNFQELTTEAQQGGLTTQIYNDELTTEDIKFKSEDIDLNEFDVTHKSEYDSTTETSVPEITDRETTQGKADDITTIISDKVKREEDYWASMMMGKNNPIEVMKEIAKISDSSIKHNMDSAVTEIVTENVPEDSTLYLRSNIESVDSSTSDLQPEEVSDQKTEDYTSENSELTIEQIEPKLDAENTSTQEYITTERMEEDTSDALLESRLRQEDDNELALFSTETTTLPLDNDELTTIQYAARSAAEDLVLTTLSSNEEVTTSVANDDEISYRSAITTNDGLVEENLVLTTLSSNKEVTTSVANDEEISYRSAITTHDGLVEENLVLTTLSSNEEDTTSVANDDEISYRSAITTNDGLVEENLVLTTLSSNEEITTSVANDDEISYRSAITTNDGLVEENLVLTTLSSNEEITTSVANDDEISYRSAITTNDGLVEEDVADNEVMNEHESTVETTTGSPTENTEAITEISYENIETKAEIVENTEIRTENPLENSESKISDPIASNKTERNATEKQEETILYADDTVSEGMEERPKMRESSIHIFDKILSNGSITKIKTHPSENKSEEKAERISHQFHHLARKYGLRPLTKRTYRDEIQKRRVTRRRDRKELLMRRRQ